MKIIFPIKKRFSDLIFSGKKIIEVRRKAPLYLTPGDTILIYESRGCKK
jgi:predicted transcriptional regulator